MDGISDEPIASPTPNTVDWHMKFHGALDGIEHGGGLESDLILRAQLGRIAEWAGNDELRQISTDGSRDEVLHALRAVAVSQETQLMNED